MEHSDGGERNDALLAAGRHRMIERDLKGRDIVDVAVLDAMAMVPRNEFMPFSPASEVYADQPGRIGRGQTISQPYIVALMTQLLGLRPGMKVLEIGTGSGYQAAVLAQMGADVYTIERHEELSDIAEAALDRCGYGDRVTLRVDDGTLGWPEESPFDRIVVTAAGPAVPESLKAQLADGGVMVMPVGEMRASQRLVALTREGGGFSERYTHDVVFVPLIGAEGF